MVGNLGILCFNSEKGSITHGRLVLPGLDLGVMEMGRLSQQVSRLRVGDLINR